MLKLVEKDVPHPLQMRFFDILQQEAQEISSSNSSNEEAEEPQLVRLCLGSSQRKHDKKETSQSDNPTQDIKTSLTLGLDVKSEFSSKLAPDPRRKSQLESETPDEEEGRETCLSSKTRKTTCDGEDNEVPQQEPVKRARVCVRARCDTATVSTPFFMCITSCRTQTHNATVRRSCKLSTNSLVVCVCVQYLRR